VQHRGDASRVPSSAKLRALRDSRLSRWHLLAIAVGAFGLGYLVCRIADWAVVSDEERIVDQLERLTAQARERNVEALLEQVRLAEFGFNARGWGELYSYGAGDEVALRTKAREWSSWSGTPSVQIKVEEDDVKVEGDRAKASAELLFEEAGRPYRQPIRVLFRKATDRWYVTDLELIRPDEFLRP
jgi:hypothetical protein